ncbi:MAG: hypothetical protein GY948_16400 [Alphaproteobacteria bacterium]|nr:hypothetical protein [Alphaproteobacteria bacterium]
MKTSKPEDVLRAIEQAEQTGTQDPIPYITAALKPKPSKLPPGVRRNGTGFYVRHDSPEFPRIKAEAEQRKDNDLYWACKRAERENGEIKVSSLWQRRS